MILFIKHYSIQFSKCDAYYMQNIMLNHADDKGLNRNKLRAFSGNWNVGRARTRVCVYL